MSIKHLISLTKLKQTDILSLVSRSVQIANKGNNVEPTLLDKIIGIYFSKTSTRTRSAFTVGALRLGAKIIAYGPNDLQINTGESVQDTARVLSGYLDALVARTAASDADMWALANQNEMSVINAMSELEHPTQALADLATILDHFGHLHGLHILYLGEGNNTAAALMLAISKLPGMKLTLLTPEGYGIVPELYEQAATYAQQSGSEIIEYHYLDKLPENVDIVYTTRWQTTGTSKADPYWREAFAPFRVTESLMQKVSKPTGTIFMHDLPAVRGEDVDSTVLDGSKSIALRQARFKLYSAMACLEWCLLLPE